MEGGDAQENLDKSRYIISKSGKVIDKLRYATDEMVFEEINKLRARFNLTPLKWEPKFIEFSLHSLRNESFDFKTDDGKSLIGTMTFTEPYKFRVAERFIKKWMHQSSKRQILLSPGSIGALSSFAVPDGKNGKPSNYLTFFISSVYF